MRATPESLSAPVRVTVAGWLRQPSASGVPLMVALVVGAVVSSLTVSVFSASTFPSASVDR